MEFFWGLGREPTVRVQRERAECTFLVISSEEFKRRFGFLEIIETEKKVTVKVTVNQRKKLKENGQIKRIGADKNGYWQVM